MSILIKDLPDHIKDLVFENQRRHGNDPNENLRVNANIWEGNFSFSDTPEGDAFWQSISQGDFIVYYQKFFPKDVTLKSRLISSSLLSRLAKIARKSKSDDLRGMLEKLIHISYTKGFNKRSLRNLTINLKGELTYLPKGKDCMLNESKSAWTTQNRTGGKYGKTLRAFMIQIGLKPEDKHIEELTNLLKSNFSDSELKVIKGKEIIDIYSDPKIADSTGSLSGSCMNDKPREYFQIYADNSEMLIMTDNEGRLKGRAILWVTECGTKVMDRIYGSDSDILVFMDWAKENGYWYKAHQTCDEYNTWFNLEGEEVTKDFKILLKGTYDYYPYMDSFKFTSNLSEYLTTNYRDDSIILNDTDGHEEYVEGRTYDEYDDRYIDSDEAVYVESRGYYTHEDNCYQDYNDEWIMRDDAVTLHDGQYASDTDSNIVYMNYKGEYALMDDAFICDHDGEWYLIDDLTDLSDLTNGEHSGTIYEGNEDDWIEQNEYEPTKEEA